MSSSKGKVVAILLGSMVFAAVVIYGVFSLFIQLSERDFIPGENVYLRDIYVIIDQTLSMADGQRQEARDVLRNEILSVMGPGDRIFCYRISSDYSESGDRVFSSSRHLPKVPMHVAGMPVKDLPDHWREEINRRWEHFESEKKNWEDRLENLQPPGGNYSDYLGTLDDIGRRISDQSDPNLAAERWLVMIGDLKHEPVMPAPPKPSPNQHRLYSGVTVQMVYPGGFHEPGEWDEIVRFWQRYFIDRGARQVQFSSFDAFVGRFPETVVPHLK